ncbi:WbqC family protein [uncultured Duncaniella sp.]|mgnify:CR=1 FL=1|uniref:WbqC family protein n=1 Tax=uncultured Duncaniella sp. TaxID=2768039 RepID=UPI0025FEF224|nr:WbqC family protein [uncultured Duncaniella sp.]
MENQTITGNITVLPPVFCGSVEHYVNVRVAEATAIDWKRRFDKRFKVTHRFAIADTRGRLELTVPIAKPQSSQCCWGDIEISTHGNWWDVHRIALESAYGRTPFFEYYADSLLPMLTAGVEERFPLLKDLSDAWDTWIRHKLMLPLPVAAETGESRPESPSIITENSNNATDFAQYWQVRADKIGFIGNLSVLDLIFNLGPEAIIYLDKAAGMTD